MALDGAFLHGIARELESAVGCRVDKIHQPSREELVFVLRGRDGMKKLLLSAGASSPRIHFTEVALENPKTPPMFCMLMRKHLHNGRLTKVRQNGLDRVLYLVFESANELGDLVTVTVAMEIMGRHSNLILIGPDGRVLDAIKRVDAEMSSVRMVLPGMPYTLPPAQDKLNLLECSVDEVLVALRAGKNAELSKALMGVLQGFSPILAREAAHFATRGIETAKDDLTGEQIDRLDFFLDGLRKRLADGEIEPTMVMDKEGKPKDFSLVPIHQYGAAMVTKAYPTASGLLDSFYAERDRIERMKQRSHDLLKLLVNQSDRAARKITAQQQELRDCANRETYKMYGDLLNANLYTIPKGASSVRVQNFYAQEALAGGEPPEVEIALDPSLSAVKNAQKYYTEYRKAATAEKMLTALIAQAKEELAYLDSVFDAVSRTTGESELLEIREELAEQGYLKHYRQKNKQLKAQPPLRYRSSDGFVILCGRNNKQNDQLTCRTARKSDIWCHTQGIPGSHVIIVSEGNPVPDQTVEEACVIAAYNSKARESAQVPVDYTELKNVWKPNGAKPGMVHFENYSTAYVTPDGALVSRLAEQNG